MEDSMRIKHIIICAIFGILLLIVTAPFILTLYSNIWGVGSENWFYNHFNEIDYYEDDVVIPSITCEIQRDAENVFYMDEESNLLKRMDDTDEVIATEVYEYLVKGKEVYYTKEEGLFCKKEDEDEKKVLQKDDMQGFLIGNNTRIVLTDDMIFFYDTQWKEIKTVDLWEKGIPYCCIQDYLYADGKIILRVTTTEAYNCEFYAYSIKENTVSKINTPISDEHEAGEDMIKYKKDVYIVFSIYTNPDICNKYERIDSPINGVYRLNTDTMSTEKVSDTCGHFLLSLNQKLYVYDKGIFLGTLKEVSVKN